jgi:hypothetical protein
MLFPDPAVVTKHHQRLKKRSWVVQDLRTFTVYPQKTTHQVPFVEGGASGKPDRRFTRVDSACNDVIFRRVRG